MAFRKQYDAVVLGGGLAGLTFALQIKQKRPKTSVLVIDKQAHPVPEAAFKVGESTVEIGAHYLADVLGMKENLQLRHLIKLGLRFFFPAGDNRDIARRFELGPFTHLPVLAFQIDRGRFENHLGGEALKHGVSFLDDCRVRKLDLDGEEGHRVTMVRGQREYTVNARWVVDASGRSQLVKRKLDLEKQVGHRASAAWFRIQDDIDVHDWSRDPEWQARLFEGLRRLSTNHLMGKGYWVWIIPLASNSTSIGIVVDENIHAFESINRFEKALEWLRQNEPQCAAEVEKRRELLQDFRIVRQFSYDCERVFSPDKWCLTGVAGVFTDAFYSPGSDLIAVSNTLVCDLVARDLDGEEIGERIELFNDLYLDFWFKSNLQLYEGLYPVMGNAGVMTAKIVWDMMSYWAVQSLLFFRDKLCDRDFLRSIGPSLTRYKELDDWVQELFLRWNETDSQNLENQYLDYTRIKALANLQSELVVELDDQELKARIAKNIALLETVAIELAARALQHWDGREATLDGEAIGLDLETAGSNTELTRDLAQIWPAADAPIAA